MPENVIQVACLIDPFFQENAYVLFERTDGPCWIVDPSFDPQPRQIREVVIANGLAPAAILVTHCHGDHIAGIDAVRDLWPDIQLYVPAKEEDWLVDPRKNLSASFGTALRIATPIDRGLQPGDSLQIDTLPWQVLDAGGHSPGGLAFYCPAGKVLITGDALFAGSIGRIDFPGSDPQRLLDNIRNNLLSLPGDVTVYAGHGPATTVAEERATNPFLQG
jgi:hydroxyacylglutathione hydrolase